VTVSDAVAALLDFVTRLQGAVAIDPAEVEIGEDHPDE
jgi:hypothetical protein